MIRVEGVNKYFPKGSNLFDEPSFFFRKPKKNKVLDDIRLNIRKGEVCAVTGKNGAGKTTLLKLLANIYIPDSGRIFLNEIQINTKSKSNVKVGFMPTGENGFYQRLSLKGNLEFYGALYNITPKESDKRLIDLFNFLGIDDETKRFQECSTGIKQRVNLARALIHDPKVLLLDEPTRSLDPVCADEIRVLIKYLSKHEGKTVLFSTHNIEEAKQIADKIIVMDNGKIVKQVKKEDFFKNLNDKYDYT